MFRNLKRGRIPFFFVLLLLCTCNSCFLFDAASVSDENPKQREQTVSSKNDEDFQLQMIKDPSVVNKTRQAEPEPQKTQYSGKAIAIPVPQFQKSTVSDAWMPQFLQDTLTGHFTSFSGMTVLDRKNEAVVIAEQKLSESGYYSADNAAAFGQMTNAEYVLTGSVQKLPTRYALSFRVNDIATNEIKASFNGQYRMSDIENGNAVKDAVIALLKGLDITLTQAQIAHLTNNRSAINATQRLAQGMAAEKEGDFITALSFLTDASEEGNNEANTVISAMLSSSTPASIRERAAYYKAQIDKWNKIWDDLENYLKNHYPILVYDFDLAKMTHSINNYKHTVDLEWAEGFKLVPNRKALVLYNTIADEWERIKNNPENKEWRSNVKGALEGGHVASYIIHIGLYNQYNELLGRYNSHHDYMTDKALQLYSRTMRFKNQSVPPQFRLYNNTPYRKLYFQDIPIDDKFTESLSVRVIECLSHTLIIGKDDVPLSNIPILSLQEWEAYLQSVE